MIEQEVGELLKRYGLTLAVAESCTGGQIGDRITSTSGSSAYFLGGIIAYSDAIKIGELGVERELLKEHGAVSESVVRQMAGGIRNVLGSDIGLGVTGIAGPGGGTDKKPVGLVFTGLSNGKECLTRQFNFSGDRAKIKRLSSQAALEMLRDYLCREDGQTACCSKLPALENTL